MKLIRERRDFIPRLYNGGKVPSYPINVHLELKIGPTAIHRMTVTAVRFRTSELKMLRKLKRSARGLVSF